MSDPSDFPAWCGSAAMVTCICCRDSCCGRFICCSYQRDWRCNREAWICLRVLKGSKHKDIWSNIFQKSMKVCLQCFWLVELRGAHTKRQRQLKSFDAWERVWDRFWSVTMHSNGTLPLPLPLTAWRSVCLFPYLSDWLRGRFYEKRWIFRHFLALMLEKYLCVYVVMYRLHE